MTAADINPAAVTSETRRFGRGVEWVLRFDGVIVAEGWEPTLAEAFRAARAARAARGDVGAMADRLRFARYAEGRAA